MWVYDPLDLGAIHLWCEDRKQVDIFVKPDIEEIERAEPGEVLGGTYPVASRNDLLVGHSGCSWP
jgi:hypothetical protein